MKKLILILFALAFASSVWATTYYVSTGGSGSTCSSGSPCSLTTGIGTLAAGDTLILNDGTYTSPIDNVPSGISDVARTTILAANARMAVITGATANSYVLEIENKNYITIDGLVIDCSALNHDCVTIGDHAGGGMGAGSSYVTFQNGEVKNSLTGSCMVNHNQSAPTVINHHVSILNSLIHDCGTTNPSFDGFDAHGVYAGFDNGLVEGNTIYNVGNSTQGGACIQQFGDSEAFDDDIYRKNILHDCQGQAILIANGSDDLVYNNIVYASELHDEGGGCLRLGAGSIRVGLYNNTVYGCQNLGIVVGSSTNSIVRNNISYGNGGAAYTDGGSGTTHDHNLEGIDPSFTNATTHDFSLQSGSAAIDTGADLSSVFSTDFLSASRPVGLAWDVGAYEFNGVSGGGGGCSTTAISTFDGSEDPLSESGCWTITGSGSGVNKVSGYAQAKGLNESSTALWTPSSSLPSDHYATFTWNLSTSGTWDAVQYVRLYTGSNGYEFHMVNTAGVGSWAINRLDGGAPTPLTTGSATWSSTEVIRFTAALSVFTVTRSGATLASVTDATYSGDGARVGFTPHVVASLTDVKLDSFEVGSAPPGSIGCTEPALSSIQQRPSTVSVNCTLTGITSGTVDLRYSFDNFVTSYAIATGVAYNAFPFVFTPTWPAQSSMKVRVCQSAICGDTPTFITRGQYLK